MAQMIYADMHCDTLPVCRDGGHSIRENDLQASLQKLKDGGCAAQCFALFTEGRNSAADFERYLAFYKQTLEEHGDLILPALRASDVSRALKLGKTAAILAVENLGFIGGDVGKLDRLEAEGVRMASLVWNFKNMLASPNLLFKDGEPMFSASNGEGLTPLGRRVCERLDELKIIIDISHLSDGGANEILAGRKIPLVASHSNARGVCGVCRNLDDETIKKNSRLRRRGRYKLLFRLFGRACVRKHLRSSVASFESRRRGRGCYRQRLRRYSRDRGA